MGEAERDYKPHYQLQAWQSAMHLVKLVYLWSQDFPIEEKYGLQPQIRRAAISIPSNIAEGAGRTGSREIVHFLSITKGSLSELETQYLLALDLGFASSDQVLEDMLTRTSKLVSGLHKFHKQKIDSSKR